MPMKAKTLGEKVREARKELHLTQSALCGDFMTRNMLSRIETGDINPSLETLRFLSARLGVPAGYLLSDTEDLSAYRRPARMEELRALYRARDWEGARDLAANEALDGDETGLILCECAVRLGMDAYRAGRWDEASAFFEEAMSCSEHTGYHTELLLAEAVFYQGLITAMKGGGTDAFRESCRRFFRGIPFMERYLLAQVIGMADGGAWEQAERFLCVCPLREPAYRTLADVWILAAKGNAAEALPSMLSLLETGAFADDPGLLLSCMEKTEVLAAAADDYRTAYQYAKKRELLAKKLGAAAAPFPADQPSPKETDKKPLGSE